MEDLQNRVIALEEKFKELESRPTLSYEASKTMEANAPKFLFADIVLNFPSTSNNTVSALTATVYGAQPGDIVCLGLTETGAGSFYTAFVSASNTVTVNYHNSTGGSQDPDSQQKFKIVVIQRPI